RRAPTSRRPRSRARCRGWRHAPAGSSVPRGFPHLAVKRPPAPFKATPTTFATPEQAGATMRASKPHRGRSASTRRPSFSVLDNRSDVEQERTELALGHVFDEKLVDIFDALEIVRLDMDGHLDKIEEALRDLCWLQPEESRNEVREGLVDEVRKRIA